MKILSHSGDGISKKSSQNYCYWALNVIHEELSMYLKQPAFISWSLIFFILKVLLCFFYVQYNHVQHHEFLRGGVKVCTIVHISSLMVSFSLTAAFKFWNRSRHFCLWTSVSQQFIQTSSFKKYWKLYFTQQICLKEPNLILIIVITWKVDTTLAVL